MDCPPFPASSIDAFVFSYQLRAVLTVDRDCGMAATSPDIDDEFYKFEVRLVDEKSSHCRAPSWRRT